MWTKINLAERHANKFEVLLQGCAESRSHRFLRNLNPKKNPSKMKHSSLYKNSGPPLLICTQVSLKDERRTITHVEFFAICNHYFIKKNSTPVTWFRTDSTYCSNKSYVDITSCTRDFLTLGIKTIPLTSWKAAWFIFWKNFKFEYIWPLKRGKIEYYSLMREHF